MQMPQVAIVLLNYNGKNYLEQNLGFVQQCSYPNKAIYIIDNGSTDDSLAFVKANYPAVHIICNKENLGYAAGYNAGLAHIMADYFVLLNTDVEVTPHFLQPVIELMEADAGIGICQPKILSGTNRNRFEYAGGAGGFIDALGFTFTRGRLFDYQEPDNGQYDQNEHIFWASGACLIIKAFVFTALQGFYGYFFMYSEEVDLCWRAQTLGFKVYACPKSVVYHRETTRLTDQPADRMYYIFRNNYVMLHRNLPWLSAITVLPARFALNKIAFFHLLFIGRFAHAGSIIKATFHYWKWALFTQKERTPKKALRKCQGVYKGSIVYQYYLLKKKKFSDLVPDVTKP
ncbi:hypothetical protein A4D02_32720 [Niastella koreensis]|nr:hypothetical protein A4D02_32720 [Niastella koreensis]